MASRIFTFLGKSDQSEREQGGGLGGGEIIFREVIFFILSGVCGGGVDVGSGLGLGVGVEIEV